MKSRQKETRQTILAQGKTLNLKVRKFHKEILESSIIQKINENVSLISLASKKWLSQKKIKALYYVE